MITQPVRDFIAKQKIPNNARTRDASIHLAMVCSLLDLDEKEVGEIAEASARVFRILKKDLPLESKYRKNYRMGTYMKNVEDIYSYIKSNMVFGSEHKLFSELEKEKSKFRGEIA